MAQRVLRPNALNSAQPTSLHTMCLCLRDHIAHGSSHAEPHGDNDNDVANLDDHSNRGLQ